MGTPETVWTSILRHRLVQSRTFAASMLREVAQVAGGGRKRYCMSTSGSLKAAHKSQKKGDRTRADAKPRTR